MKKLIIMMLTGMMAWGTWPVQAETGVREAFDLRMEGRTDEAIRVLEADFAAEPGGSLAFYEMARVRLYLLDFSACLAAIDRAVALDPDNPRYLFLAGFAATYGVIDAAHHQDQEKMKEMGRRAIRDMEEAVKADPDLHEARFLLVQQLTNMAPELGLDTSGKEDQIRILEEKDPIWGAKARGLELDKEARLAQWETLLAEHEDEARAWYEAADSFIDLADLDRASECLDRAIALDPYHFYLLLRLSNAYAMKQDWSQATAAVERYLGFDTPRPLEAWAVGHLGQIKKGQGDQVAGRKLVAKAETLDPHVWKTFMPPPEILFTVP